MVHFTAAQPQAAAARVDTLIVFPLDAQRWEESHLIAKGFTQRNALFHCLNSEELC